MSTLPKHLRSMTNQDGAAILDTNAGIISTLNSTGAFIWLALVAGEAPERIAARLAKETGEDLTVVERDIQDFIQSLDRHRLSSTKGHL